ncbi:hypothetical protein FF098_002465 [Parvularcula flava]|uniref:DUF6265 domain-containing protein n=1 Tax=Aquisalinus luteolus TaxID=1566827 RepID=A0A8J3EQ39_9PROT|nr:DUF6265 family protein [Aquisalinus luteolus]NHK26771.1 hypothetical protein [Aquisalinus luteolus]GGH93361.1 hypothetical protein GCM10011355_05020 [Aquisalinus luteolus]
MNLIRTVMMASACVVSLTVVSSVLDAKPVLAGDVVLAQGDTETPSPLVMHLSADQQPVKATIEDAAWLEGSWSGTYTQIESEEGVTVEHHIYPEAMSHMPGFVRAHKDGEFRLYEISAFAEVEGTLLYRVKHFGYEFEGWEPADQSVESKLVAITDDTLFFDGITFHRLSKDNFVVYFEMTGGPDEGKILVVPFKRQ